MEKRTKKILNEKAKSTNKSNTWNKHEQTMARKPAIRPFGHSAIRLISSDPRIVDFFQVTFVNSTSEGHCLPHGQIILSSRTQTMKNRFLRCFVVNSAQTMLHYKVAITLD